MKKVYLLALTIIMITAVLTGCGGSEPAYAAPMVDNLLLAIEDRDYEAFSRDLSDTMKSAMTEESFNSLADLLKTKIGSYQQRSFGESADTTQDGVKMTVIAYIAKYSDEPGNVLITVSFGEEGKTIEGLYFTSPKLQQQ